MTVTTAIAKRIGRWAAALQILCLLSALFVPALAVDSTPRRLRVAFPQVEGLSETAPDGTRYGLIVDYLNEISKYTGWEYEYIDTTGETMLDEFKNGAFDLVGGAYYMPALEATYAYPDYNTGYSKSVLLSRRNDESIHPYDLHSLNGKTIGVYERATENIRRLKEFLSINGLNCPLRLYTYEDLGAEGELYPYLQNGEVDLLLGNSGERTTDFRVAVSYDAQPYYIVTTVSNQEVLNGLNLALEKIVESNPNFAAERYAANFSETAFYDIQLNQNELNYIRQKDVVTVAIPESFHPMVCSNTGSDIHNGITPDMLEEISLLTGLRFSCIFTDSYSESIQLVQQGKADLLGFFLGTEAESVPLGLSLTSPYVSINSIVVRNKSSSYPDTDLTGAVIDGWDIPGTAHAAEVRRYATHTEALAAVNQGKVDFVYGLAARLEQDIQLHHFTNLVPVTLVNDRTDICFATVRPAPAELLTVMNKAINSLSDEKKTEIMNRNLISIGASKFSLRELVYANPIAFIAVLSVLLTILVTIVLWVNRTRTRAAMMQVSLEQAKAESKAKGEFLSRMSHEMRTPMNAVVGLADLTCMTEGVPDTVRDNLAKLRSSSRYLLNLINDILDMSRLDSGMLSIASEPFSLERMLREIQSMMESEAQRRSLHYTLEQKITHCGVMGDAIRLRQVLTNLLSNAFKFTPAGGTVLLRVTEIDGDEADGIYTFQVIDSGAGIAPSEQARIFETFEQLGTNYSKSQGTGLGLPISRSIVQMMGGELSLNSAPGRGSEFYFTIALPLCETADQPSDQPALSADGLALDGAHILIAEDNDLNAEIAVQLLEMQGTSVERCENGAVTVKRFAESQPRTFDLILMDIQMPVMNGLEATRAIRALERPDAGAIPIIAMTANTFQEDVAAATAAGMNGFLTKPLDVDYLYSMLHDILKRGASPGQGGTAE